MEIAKKREILDKLKKVLEQELKKENGTICLDSVLEITCMFFSSISAAVGIEKQGFKDLCDAMWKEIENFHELIKMNHEKKSK